MEKLKKFEEIIMPDARTTGFVIVNRETGHKREFDIKDLHEEVASIRLGESVPEEVRSEFNIARNVCLYSWFCYAFHNVACLKAYTTIELALRLRLGRAESRTNLGPMLREAVTKGLLSDKWAPEMITRLRNLAAHGSTMNGPWSLMIIRATAELLNELFSWTQGGT